MGAQYTIIQIFEFVVARLRRGALPYTDQFTGGNMKRTTLILASMLISGTAWADTAYEAVAFVDGAVAESLTGTPGDAAEGRKVMESKALGNCVTCHQVTAMADVPFHGEIGPSLDGAADRWDEAQLRGIIANAKMTFEGSMMPSFYKTTGFIRPGDAFTGKAATEPLAPLLTGQQIEDVVAYLLTLKE
jgi:sulfur-oxidizing protein SoxX